MSDSQSEATTFEGHAIIELFGHNIIAGYCCEQVIAGSAMLRVDVPDVGDKPGFTKFFSASAIYAITPTTEEHARQAAERIDVRPVRQWIVPERPALPVSQAEPGPGDDLDAWHDDYDDEY